MRVLILDDHQAIQFFVKQQVLALMPSAEIVLCSHIDEAKEVVKTFDPQDFVICDLEINEGVNTTIPELCFNLKMPCMIYSSHVNKTLLSELSRYEVNCYVSKLSGIEDLKRGIMALVDGEKFHCSIVNSISASTVMFKEIQKLALTGGQKVVLEVLAKGFNRAEASKILNIKMTTLNNHIARARELNDCENFEELLRRYRFWDMLN
jgi:DNA-binding NarL/FixJ family response regulator